MAYIYDLTDTWNAGGTTFNGIKLNVTDSASAVSSKLVTLQTNGTEHFSVTKAGVGYFSGNLGVGTSSPGDKLSIAAGRIRLDQDYQIVWQNAGTNRARIAGDSGNNILFENGSANTERMRITDAGNVGIGTTTPAATLTVGGVGGVDRTIQLGSAGATRGVLATDGVNGVFSIGATNDSTTGILTFKTGSALTEKMRIDASGNLLVGTTAVAGAASNAAIVSNGGVKTASGSVSATTAVATTAFSITAGNRGRYEVVVMIPNSGDASLYTAIATVIWDGSTGRVVANNGTRMTITLSGSDVQVTQTSGSTQTLFWSVQRIAL